MTYILTGRYPLGSLDGRPGVLKFEPSTTIVGDGNVVLPAPVSVRLDADGAFSQALIGTDDPLYAPSGWVWTVTEVMTGGRDPWSFELTADSDIADLATVATPAEYTVNVPATRILTAGAGLTGGGTLAADRTFAVGAGIGISVAADSVALDLAYADDRYAAGPGANLGRFIARAQTGAPLKITVLGDSVWEGALTTAGVNDALTLVAADLSARYGCTVTPVNWALSGSTIASAAVQGRVAGAIAAAADLYILAHGKIDTVQDHYAAPTQGYPLTASMRYTEALIREIRRTVPHADILVAAPTPATTGSDAELHAYTVAKSRLAAAYGCEFVDLEAAFTDLGDYSAYMGDGTHPNVAGHRLIADTVLTRFPADWAGASHQPSAPTTAAGLYAANAIHTPSGSCGWVPLNVAGLRMTNVGAGWSGFNPYVTSTAGNYTEISFVGTDLIAKLSLSTADALVATVTVDGVAVHTDQSFTTVPSNSQPYVTLASGLTAGAHVVRVTLVSGTLRLYAFAHLATISSQLPVPFTPRSYVSDRWYLSPLAGAPPTSQALTAGTAYVMPFHVGTTMLADRIAIHIHANVAGASVVLGMYASDANDQPGKLLWNAGTLDASTLGFKYISLPLAETITPGIYWLACLVLGGNASVKAYASGQPGVTTPATTFANNYYSGYSATGLASLPDTWTGTAATLLCPLVGLRAD